MRLDKYLSDMNIGTRSEIKKRIRAGSVSVSGMVIRDPGQQVGEGEEICIDGKNIGYEQYQYYMLNKPAGIISASEDRKERTVVDLLRENDPDGSARKDLFPVGRLDKDTEGLLVITNDGELTHRLLSPDRHVDKVYYAEVSGMITGEDMELIRRGIQFDEHLKAKPAKIELLSAGHEMQERERILFEKERHFRENCESYILPERRQPETGIAPVSFSKVLVTIQEGRFHQIRKMLGALGQGKMVIYLKRLSMGSLRLDDSLPPGACRKLTEEEILGLKESGETE